MAQYKLIPYDEACVLYDCGLREIACVSVPFGNDCMELAVRYATRGSWEPGWMGSWWRENGSTTIHKWTYCIEVE